MNLIGFLRFWSWIGTVYYGICVGLGGLFIASGMHRKPVWTEEGLERYDLVGPFWKNVLKMAFFISLLYFTNGGK